MKLTITPDSKDVFLLEVDANESLENLKALIEVESGILTSNQLLLWNGRELVSTQQATHLDQLGVQDNDVVAVYNRTATGTSTPPPTMRNSASTNSNIANSRIVGSTSTGTSAGTSTGIDPIAFREHVRNNPDILQQLLHSNPALAEAVLSDDLPKLSSILSQQEMRRRQDEAERLRRINQLNSDPFNPELQKEIAEEIRLSNVEENMEHAYENIPEAFGRVVMLYCDCVVNNTPVKAFIDSGAQQTIMSVECAERCGIMRLVDKRFHGIAKGVGTAKIIGRVHVAPIKLGNSFFPCSFTILEGQGQMDFLLGLDMLRRHQCMIDLKANVLCIGDEAVPFLAEKDIPKSLMLSEEGTPASSSTSSTSTTSSSEEHRAKSSNPASSTMTLSEFPDTLVKQLMSLGFPREQVLNALRLWNGNAEAAASYLFQNSGMNF